MLSDTYDSFTLIFVRNVGAVSVLVVVSLVWFRGDLFKLLRNPASVLGLGFITVVFSYTWTAGCYGSTAIAAHLITKLNVVFVIILSFLLFHEERAVIRSLTYLSGTALSIVGVAAVLMDEPSSLVPALDTASLLLLLTAVLWSVYIVWGKHVVTNIHPIPTFTLLALFTTAAYGFGSNLLGDPVSLTEAGWRATALALFSGVFCIAVGHCCFLFAQKHLGAALCTSLLLLSPFITLLLSLILLPNEQFLPTQMMGGGILIVGTFLVTYAARRAHAHNNQSSETAIEFGGN